MELFLELMSTGPPEAFRESATRAVSVESERNAARRDATLVAVEDVLRACLSMAPPVFRPQVIEGMRARGFDPDTYSPEPAMTTAMDSGGMPAAPAVGSFSTEWDCVRGTIASHGAEVDHILRIAGLSSVESALDLACGTGGHLLELARRGARCTGVDRLPGKLARADRRARAAGTSLSLVCSDLRRLPLLGSYDLVVCLYAMSMMRTDADVLAALASARGRLGRGGRLVFNVIDREVNDDPRSPTHVLRGHVRDFSRREIETLVLEAGLRPRRTESMDMAGLAGLDLYLCASRSDDDAE